MRQRHTSEHGRPSSPHSSTASLYTLLTPPTHNPGILPRSWSSTPPSPDIALPQHNQYLPTDFELCCGDEGSDAPPEPVSDGVANGQSAVGLHEPAAAAFPSPPRLLLDEPGLRVWHKLDDSFRQPRTNAQLRLYSPAGYASPRGAALSHLALKGLEDALCETAYLAEVAGLHYGLWCGAATAAAAAAAAAPPAA